MHEGDSLPLPKQWPDCVRLAVVQAVALAHTAITFARGWAVDSPFHRVRLSAQVDQLRSEVALLRREGELIKARFARVPAKSRPHYLPEERLEILELKAARCWNAAQAAKRLLLAPSTIAEWLARLTKRGQEGFLEPATPVNKFPDLVHHVVRSLRSKLPTMGKKRIAQLLARAGLHLSSSTVSRMLERQEPPPKPAPFTPKKKAKLEDSARSVTANHPGHVWNVDFTCVASAAGFWAPWFPFALPQVWPFSWHIAVLVDHFSRKILRVTVFRKEPTAAEFCAFLDAAVKKHGAPTHIVSDQGAQFQDEYRAWCKTNGVKPRFGAIGKHGSIALTERTILSVKSEHLWRILIPLRHEGMMAELDAYVLWFNEHRPHQGLAGKTPNEVFFGKIPARDGPRFETRKRFPLEALQRRSTHQSKLRAPRGAKLVLVSGAVENRPHLPIVELKRAA